MTILILQAQLVDERNVLATTIPLIDSTIIFSAAHLRLSNVSSTGRYHIMQISETIFCEDNFK
jgi:hypothetical protein